VASERLGISIFYEITVFTVIYDLTDSSDVGSYYWETVWHGLKNTHRYALMDRRIEIKIQTAIKRKHIIKMSLEHKCFIKIIFLN